MMPDICLNGRCINTMGSYRCICNRGFKVDTTSTYCRDVNECSLRPSPCKFSCQNTEGSYVCSCPPGFELNAGMILIGYVTENLPLTYVSYFKFTFIVDQFRKNPVRKLLFIFYIIKTNYYVSMPM